MWKGRTHRTHRRWHDEPTGTRDLEVDGSVAAHRRASRDHRGGSWEGVQAGANRPRPRPTRTCDGGAAMSEQSEVTGRGRRRVSRPSRRLGRARERMNIIVPRLNHVMHDPVVSCGHRSIQIVVEHSIVVGSWHGRLVCPSTPQSLTIVGRRSPTRSSRILRSTVPDATRILEARAINPIRSLSLGPADDHIIPCEERVLCTYGTSSRVQ